jgi:hypothetical protein
MCSSMSRSVRVGLAAVAISVCGVARADVTRVYEWSENGGRPVISNALPPASIKQYTIQTLKVPPLSAEQHARIEKSLAAYRAALATPVPRSPDAPMTVALSDNCY